MRINQNATTQDIYNRYNESLNQRKNIEKVSSENSIDNNQTSSANKISITAYKEETSEKVSSGNSIDNNQTSSGNKISITAYKEEISEKVSSGNSIDNNQTSSANKISITVYKEEVSEKVSRVKSANNNQTSATDTLETSEKMKGQSDNGKYEINHPDQVIKQAQLNGLAQANQPPTAVLDLLR